MRRRREITRVCALLACFGAGLVEPSRGLSQDAWKPFRPTKLFEASENLRFRRGDLGVAPQDFPSRALQPAPPDRLPSQELPPAAAQNEPPAVAPAPQSLPPPRSELGSTPRLDAGLAQENSPQFTYPPTNQFIDEFDLMPHEPEHLYGTMLAGPPVLTKFKSGFFQKLNVQATVIDPAASSGFALTEIETALTVAVPAPTRDFPLLISPTFEARFLDGPVAPDLPPTLYTAGVDFMWVPTVGDRLRGLISVAPMVYSDFETQDADMFRVTGKGIVQWDVIPEQLQLVGGVLYLNRDDVRLLPVAGVIWNPNAYWNFELLFPRPRIARLINYGAEHSDWVYLLGEFGGNTWSVLRESGEQDKVTLRDVRLMLGLERRKNGGVNYRFEVGYVFAREIEYLSATTPDFAPADTLLLRVGTTF